MRGRESDLHPILFSAQMYSRRSLGATGILSDLQTDKTESVLPAMTKPTAPSDKNLECPMLESHYASKKYRAELTALKAENERLKGALQEMVQIYDLIQCQTDREVFKNMVYGFYEPDGTITRARQALRKFRGEQ